MTLDEIILDLQYGELSAHGMFAMGAIDTNDKKRLVHHINTCLTELYGRFPLLFKELTLIQYSYITSYHLHSDYSYSIGTARTRYIYDTPEDPFTNDVIKVETIVDEVGDPLLLNSNGLQKVATFPAPDIIEIPNPVESNALFVVYRAKHPLVTIDTIELMLPDNLKPALLAYVASKVYSGGTAQEHALISNNLFQKYELFCTQQDTFGNTNANSERVNLKPEIGGWI